MIEYVLARKAGSVYVPPVGFEYPYYLDGLTVRQLGITGPNTSFKVGNPGRWRQELVTFLDSKHGSHSWELFECLPPGAYYPRIARLVHRSPIGSQIMLHSSDKITPPEVIAGAKGQLASLLQLTQRVLSVVHPESSNFQSYGHDIRNLIILACTEVEAQWKGIMMANGYQSVGRFSTNDYVKLEPAMRLGQFKVVFSYFPSLAPFAPFGGWVGSTSPTQDLGWYDDYNAVKHDREASFPRGTLEAALNAIAACAIMLVAQFGAEALARPDLGSFFRMESVPVWGPGEAYIKEMPGHGGSGPIMFPF